MIKSERLKTLRILYGYTQDELAQRINAPRSALSIWENPKKYGPSEESVPALAEALNVSPGYLTYGDTQNNTSVWIPQLPARKHHQQIFVSELKRLLPHFLFENKFANYLTANLADGGKLFLFSKKDSNSGMLLFNSLLLASADIKDAISMSIKLAEISKLDNSLEERDLSPNTVSNISTIAILGWFRETTNNLDVFCDIDFDGMSIIFDKYNSRALSKGKNVNTIEINSPIEAFYLFIKHVCPDIGELDVTRTSVLYNSICSEISRVPADEINEKLKKIFSNELSSFRELEKQQPAMTASATPSNHEFQTISEWLKEELSDSKSPKERELFLKKLAKGTDFKAWKEKRDQENGMKPLLWDF